ncbi:uncharacterized protein PgNI_02728 [Pyricularia grisea]|uniref:Uncharacterized protein n=1 Tax=Pyricularia grisea TaxID=148305 RepID=A0A6P8B9F4_PYRGI|nr:uncharacterized protein PgNI_02728 [Pyricularia grisea]TLD12292.1 hypothetical protein PgNI_02728 [Pyricularia grisea]
MDGTDNIFGKIVAHRLQKKLRPVRIRNTRGTVVGKDKWAADQIRFFFQLLAHLRCLKDGKCQAAGLHNARLVPGNLWDCAAKLGGMVEPDSIKTADNRVVPAVGRIPPAADINFVNADFNPGMVKNVHRKECEQLKISGHLFLIPVRVLE